MAKKKNKDLDGDAKAGKKKSKGNSRLLVIFAILTASVFMPTSLILLVGMLPTLVAVFIDNTKGRSSTVTIGALNFAGCVPFLLKLWSQGQTIDTALSILKEPSVVVIIYSAAAAGYLLDWAMTRLISEIVYKTGSARLAAISKKQQELVVRWGQDVKGGRDEVLIDDSQANSTEPDNKKNEELSTEKT